MSRALILGSSLLVAGLLVGCTGGGGVASPSSPTGSPGASPGPSSGVAGDLAAVCEAGTAEGTFVYWESEEPEILDAMQADFAEAYPGIEIEPLSLRPEEITQRLILEDSSDREVTTDLVQGNLDALLPLIERDIVDAGIDWTALDVGESLVSDGNMVRSSRIANGLVYNTDVSTPEALPNTWEELVNEQWTGEVVVDPRSNPLQSLALVWGKDETVDFVQRLKDTADPVVIEGGTAGMLTVASGENVITTNGRSAETLEQRALGAPLEIKYLDIVPTADFYEAVVAGAPHPSAAACWVGWLSSEAGRASHLEHAFKHNDDVPPGAPEGAQIAAIETADEAALAAETAQEISAIWGSGAN